LRDNLKSRDDPVSLESNPKVERTSAESGRAAEHVDFADLVGQWVADPAFDEIIEAQRQIDPEKWSHGPSVGQR